MRVEHAEPSVGDERSVRRRTLTIAHKCVTKSATPASTPTSCNPATRGSRSIILDPMGAKCRVQGVVKQLQARSDGSARRSSPRAVPASPRASPPTALPAQAGQADSADWHRRRVVRRCAGRSKHCRRSTRCPSGSSPSTRAAWPRHPTGDDPTVGDDHCIPRVRPGMQSPATSAEPSASPGPRRRRYWPQRPESSLSSPAPSPSTAAALSCCQSPTQQGHRS